MTQSTRNGIAFLLMTCMAVLALYMNWRWAYGSESGYRFGRCVIAARDLPTGTRITEVGKDVHERFCRLPIGKNFPVRASQVIGRYVSIKKSAWDWLSSTDIQDIPPKNSQLLRVFVRIPDERGACLEPKDQLLLVRVLESGERKVKVIPDPKRYSKGLEILEVGRADDSGYSLITVALPSKFLKNAVQLSQRIWIPILLNPGRPGTCPQPPAQTPSQTEAEKE